ncbi:hypothetical protein ANCCEY_13597 [Ancylostoma ceylanicum]|uniref:DUF659 domain-containing protein n=1 Tax=Ancylostoma ceylanicum TaxID=53326 RepID=A0A0D6L6N8_9BILA|nr:hypothetical protein ANCCEY_13597 [Ancylostoma ceylanicum]
MICKEAPHGPSAFMNILVCMVGLNFLRAIEFRASIAFLGWLKPLEGYVNELSGLHIAGPNSLLDSATLDVHGKSSVSVSHISGLNNLHLLLRPATPVERHHLKTKHPKSFKEMQQSDKELKENVKEKIKNKERSLKRSLKVVQLEESSAPKTSRKEEDTPSIVQVFKEYEPDGIRTVKIERAILQFICTATLPLSIVENRGFQNLMSILCPRFKIKSRTHFTRNSLVDLYNEYWTKVDEMLSGASHISFACDTWTSADNNHSILGLTAHFISKDMVPKFVVAAATPIKTRHTAENTKALLAKVLGTFNIGEEKIHMFVRDAATSMVATTNLLNMKSWDCFAHKIQLAVKDGLKILDSFENGSNSLIARLTSIVRKLKKSGVDKESFKEYQTLCDVPNRMLVKVSHKLDFRESKFGGIPCIT